MSPQATSYSAPPSSILIVGAGVFGLSTAYSLLTNPRYENTHITILDSRTPTPDEASNTSNGINSSKSSSLLTASHDSSRIVRADYANSAYARLAAEAQREWRGKWGHRSGQKKGRYHECGLALTAENGTPGEKYVRDSLDNVRSLNDLSGTGNTGSKDSHTYREGNNEGEQDGGNDVNNVKEVLIPEGKHRSGVEELRDSAAIGAIMKGTQGGSGDFGYVNWDSGWVDAEGAMDNLRAAVADRSRQRSNVQWLKGSAARLITDDPPAVNASSSTFPKAKGRVLGVELASDDSLDAATTTTASTSSSTSTPQKVMAQTTLLAIGAWTCSILPSLSSHLQATGQIVAYIRLDPDEAIQLSRIPVLLNLSTGMFIIPPTPDGILKIARHGFGYKNFVDIDIDPNAKPNPPPSKPPKPSLPHPSSINPQTPLPPEAITAFRQTLQTLLPTLSTRLFHNTRICWYTDTPTGDFLIDWHPDYERGSLLLATGGSGHGFKFLPVMGDRVVERLEGFLEEELAGLWRFRGRGWEGEEGEGEGGGDIIPWETEDGSRGGRRGMIWEEEMMRDEGKQDKAEDEGGG